MHPLAPPDSRSQRPPLLRGDSTTGLCLRSPAFPTHFIFTNINMKNLCSYFSVPNTLINRHASDRLPVEPSVVASTSSGSGGLTGRSGSGTQAGLALLERPVRTRPFFTELTFPTKPQSQSV